MLFTKPMSVSVDGPVKVTEEIVTTSKEACEIAKVNNHPRPTAKPTKTAAIHLLKDTSARFAIAQAMNKQMNVTPAVIS